jgi:hypothetical protein
MPANENVEYDAVMMGSQRDRYISWALGAVAGVSVGMSILDVIGIAPGWAAKLTPFFVGVLLLYVVLERERVDSVKYIVRRLDKGIDKLRVEIRRTQAARGQFTTTGANGKTYRSILWKGMVFRSKTEVKIAKALDQAGVLFLPPTKSRLNVGKSRQSREIDFLIFYEGHWGMLEVDGPWHNAATDNARDELLHASGIQRQRIQRFDSDRCYHDPRGVVSEFLARLGEVAAPAQTVVDAE